MHGESDDLGFGARDKVRHPRPPGDDPPPALGLDHEQLTGLLPGERDYRLTDVQATAMVKEILALNPPGLGFQGIVPTDDHESYRMWVLFCRI